jgi:hypothetical protein
MSTARLYQVKMDECEEEYVTESYLSLLGACVHSDGQW